MTAADLRMFSSGCHSSLFIENGAIFTGGSSVNLGVAIVASRSEVSLGRAWITVRCEERAESKSNVHVVQQMPVQQIPPMLPKGEHHFDIKVELAHGLDSYPPSLITSDSKNSVGISWVLELSFDDMKSAQSSILLPVYPTRTLEGGAWTGKLEESDSDFDLYRSHERPANHGPRPDAGNHERLNSPRSPNPDAKLPAATAKVATNSALFNSQGESRNEARSPPQSAGSSPLPSAGASQVISLKEARLEAHDGDCDGSSSPRVYKFEAAVSCKAPSEAAVGATQTRKSSRREKSADGGYALPTSYQTRRVGGDCCSRPPGSHARYYRGTQDSNTRFSVAINEIPFIISTANPCDLERSKALFAFFSARYAQPRKDELTEIQVRAELYVPKWGVFQSPHKAGLQVRMRAWRGDAVLLSSMKVTITSTTQTKTSSRKYRRHALSYEKELGLVLPNCDLDLSNELADLEIPTGCESIETELLMHSYVVRVTFVLRSLHMHNLSRWLTVESPVKVLPGIINMPGDRRGMPPSYDG